MLRHLVTGCLFFVSCYSVSAPIKFAQQQLEIDFKITHKVDIADLSGNGENQMIVIGEDKNQQRLLAIYQLNENKTSFTLQIESIIPKHFLAYDLVKSKDRQKLVFQSSEGLFAYSPIENRFTQFAEVKSIYLEAESSFLASRDFAKDINGDLLDDIIVTDFTVMHLFLQNAAGDFTHQSIPMTPKMKSGLDSATYTEKKFFFADMNLDKKPDLILVKDAGLIIYLQNAAGIFASDIHHLTLPIDVKALDWWEIRESDGESMDQNKLAYRTMHQIEDINNDGLADIIIRYSQTEGVLDRHNNYEVYLGKVVNDQLAYLATPDSVLQAEGTTVSFETIDIDGDQIKEALLSSLDIGVPQIIGALLSGDIDQDVYVFKMDQNSVFSKEPEVSKEVEMNFSLSSGKSGTPVVGLADFDGDGLKDLLFSDGQKYLRTYNGVKESRLFNKRSEKHKVKLPKDGDFVITEDLNGDGKHDVIIRYGRQDDQSLGNKIVLLLAE